MRLKKYLVEAKKPPKLGNVWAVGAKCFNKKGKQIGVCLDTPNAIAKAMMENPDIYSVKSILGKKTRKDYEDRMKDWNKAESNFERMK